MIDLNFIGRLLHDAIWSGVAALGFAILFNVPTRTLRGCLVCGAAGHVVRTITMQLGLSIELATLASATIVGFVGTAFARRWQTPAAVFTVSGVIPLVPGVFAFQTMLGLLDVASAIDPATGLSALLEVSQNGIKTGLILMAIAAGIAAPTLLFERRKPVV
jgi:uncharacterized membrane protein YjjB (DUF3815 family)